MTDFVRAFDEAMQHLRIQEACTHIWGKPERALNRFGRRSTQLFQTRCAVCGRYATRVTLKRLQAEVIEARSGDAAAS